jgi:hypothetical protein
MLMSGFVPEPTEAQPLPFPLLQKPFSAETLVQRIAEVFGPPA